MDELYSDIILHHYRHPHNNGTLKNPTVRVREYNPLCGDVIMMDAMVGREGIIKRVKFSGEGCAISQASASLLTDTMIGMPIKKIQQMSADDIQRLLHIPISPGRMKCALLPLSAAKRIAAEAHVIQKPYAKKSKGTPAKRKK